jgi:hypothetical protein
MSNKGVSEQLDQAHGTIQGVSHQLDKAYGDMLRDEVEKQKELAAQPQFPVGGIIGIVLGVLFLIILIGVAILWRKRNGGWLPK